ncbi:hypothetical protein H1R20_g5424, partial [Candolleomyces eurysporus]
MVSKYSAGYRGILRELRKSLDPSRKVNPVIRSHFRSIVESARANPTDQALVDIDSTILFLRSQREHKRLVDRYNPLHDLTEPERIKATANRVGLNLPKLPNSESQ